MDKIPWIIIGLVWLLNFGISWWNARTVGLVWVETKQIGGWQRFMTWMGGIMSASGFTWCLLVVLLIGAYYAQFAFLEPGDPLILTERHINGGFSLGYLIIIPGVLFSGMMIWIDSLVEAWKRRDLPSIGIAAWNTYAQAHNTYEAFSGFGNALEGVGDLFSGGGDSDDAKGKLALLGVVIVVGLVILACIGGIFLTVSIVRHYAATRPAPESPVGARNLRRHPA